jgi:hypothetical protein
VRCKYFAVLHFLFFPVLSMLEGCKTIQPLRRKRIPRQAWGLLTARTTEQPFFGLKHLTTSSQACAQLLGVQRLG